MTNFFVQIKDFNGYKISPEGIVYSDISNMELKHSLRPNGYLFVTLYKDKIPYRKTIHRLVAEAYIPNPENKPQVNHKDGDKKNNKVENLEWVTQSENELHKYHVLNVNGSFLGRKHAVKSKLKMSQWQQSHKRLGKDNPMSKPILCVEKNKIYPSLSDASRELKIPISNLSKCLHEERNTCGGYHWRLK